MHTFTHGKRQRFKTLIEKRQKIKIERKKRYLLRKQYQKNQQPIPSHLETKQPITIENSRRQDETTITPENKEVLEEDEVDEFSPYFSKKITPKIMITTSRHPAAKLLDFLSELLHIIPNVFYYKRGPNKIKALIRYAISKNFTDLIILSEKSRVPNGLYIIHLPGGPTTFFNLTSLKLAQKLKNSATSSEHFPELILNNFNSRLGHRLGRQLAALFPLIPEFTGRRVITFHNQRDFIFFRHHRYIFNEEGEKCRLQEIGPRFTLKLHWMQPGILNTKEGQFEYVWRPDLQVDRRMFYI